jgi:DeoR family transcriptional regulator, ulaG and ulaABCDEF operon transcriptional repressor
MLEREREEKIISYLRQRRFASVHDLVTLTESSEATIRRDLQRLDEETKLHRVRGGAEAAAFAGPKMGPIPESLENAPGPIHLTGDTMTLKTRRTVNEPQKRRIAAHAAKMCEDGTTLFIHGGSTTSFVAEYLHGKTLVIVTNSLAIATQTYYSLGCTSVVSGGIIDPDSELIIDPAGRNFYSDYSADLFIMGAEGVSIHGVTNTHATVVQSARQMLEQARRVVLLVDSTKFGRTGHLRVCDIEKIDVLVTDSGAPEEECQRIRDAGTQVVIVPREEG